MSDSKTEIAAGLAKVTPPITVGSSILAGIELSDVVLAATLLYTCVQIFITIYNFVKANKKA